MNTGQGRIPIPILLSKFPCPINNLPVTIDGAAKPLPSYKNYGHKSTF